MKKIPFGLKSLVGAIALTSVISGYASNCPDVYPLKQPLRVENSVELCNSFYASNYDVSNRAVIFTTEILRKTSNVGSINRLGTFKQDRRILSPKPVDYTGTGYDRGHMVPSDDASTLLEMSDSFLMTNAIPQNPTLNRGSWKSLENKIRKDFSLSLQDVWVVTVPIYNKGGYISNIPVPTGIWKIVYINGGVKYYFAENTESGKVKQYPSVPIQTILNNSRNF